jgi:hypothetical protein
MQWQNPPLDRTKSLLRAALDRALRHFAQTPQETTALMARYCETLGAVAA